MINLFLNVLSFLLSWLNTYHIAVMRIQEGNVFPKVYKASVVSEFLHIAFFSSSNSTFFCLLSL